VIRKRQSELRLNGWLPAECTGLRVVPRGTTTEARFIDIEACTFRIFDAVRKSFAIGHDGSDLDRVLHLRFELATRRAVIANYMNFLSEFEIRVGHWELIPHGAQQGIPHRQENVEPCVWARMVREMVGSRRAQHWW
jgi:hypothetical protein